jgi:hypothetical protein
LFDCEPYKNLVIPVAALLLVLLSAESGLAADARSAAGAFLARLNGVNLTTLAVTESFTLYDPAGRRAQATGERRWFVKIPGRLRIEETLEDRREVRLVADSRAWVRRSDGAVYEAPPGEAQRARSQLLTPLGRSAADLLAEWRAHGVRDDIAREERAGDRTVTVIGARPGDRTSPAVWLDPEWGVVRFIAREKLPAGEGLVDVTLSDHRRLVKDFYYPFRQEIFLDGRLLTRVTVKSVEVNQPLAADLFDPEALRRGR